MLAAKTHMTSGNQDLSLKRKLRSTFTDCELKEDSVETCSLLLNKAVFSAFHT
jgi:hypothetical protein